MLSRIDAFLITLQNNIATFLSNKNDKTLTTIDNRLREQPTTITKYDEQLVRRLIENVTVYEIKFTVKFKSGVTVDVTL